ncbi:MAG: hypothetical protein RLY30_27 [Pseudomonadota bacterium]|jgi:hypothetical protein
MKLPNLLDHAALNQLRLGMDAPLVTVEKGWAPRLLNAEAIRRLGRAPTPAQMPTALSGQPPSQTKPKVRPPTEYLREKGSKILNPMEPVKGEVDWSSRTAAASAPAPAPTPVPTPASASASASASAPAPAPAASVAPAPEPNTQDQAATNSTQRRRRNQDALNRLKGL